MRRSVSTHSLGIEAPSLDDPRLVLKGAGHFESGCRPCHGSPVLPHSRIAKHMTPQPPNLSETAAHWDREELFYIVKHGVKFTGMPAWPTQQRDDEVWAMTAFLLELPDLDARKYRRLVHGETADNEDATPLQNLVAPQEAPRAVIENCARCHGIDGLGRGEGAFPVLAGQHAVYLRVALEAYAQGERNSGIMAPIAADLSDAEMRQLSRYYAALDPAKARVLSISTEAIERGKMIARRGVPTKGVPACISCHGPADAPKNPHYPVLAGQYADYLILQLILFRHKDRGGSAYAHLMRSVASQLTEKQMNDVAVYYASLHQRTALSQEAP